MAETYPPFDGGMTFQAIQGPEGPEEYSWEVQLGAEQELRQVDEHSAAVFYENGPRAFAIDAIAAHDAEGKTVPTTLAVTQPNIITLTVHHRSAPFDYPVVQGAGWEGGFQTVPVVIVEPTHEGPPPTCVVPDLTGRTLRASRKLLHQSHCRLGVIHGEQVRAAHIVKQYRQYGKSLPVWTKVDVKALTGLQHVRAN